MRCQCIICTDNFDGASDIASVPCGHTFHDACLDRWLKSNPSCPTCRVRVKSREVRKIYLQSLDDTITDSGRIENELSDARIRIHELRQKQVKLEEDLEQMRTLFKAKEEEASKYKQKYYDASRDVKTFKAKEKFIKEQLLENQQLHQTITELRQTIEKTSHLKAILNGTTRDVEDLLTTYGPGENSVRQIATYCVLIKRELTSAKSELRVVRNEAMALPRQLKIAKAELAEKDRKLEAAIAEAAKFKTQCTKLTNELENLPEHGRISTGTKRSSDKLSARGLGEAKKTKLDSSLDITVVPSPPVLKHRTGYLAEKKSTSSAYPPSLAGYSKMKIVTGEKKPTNKTQDDASDDLLLKMMMMRKSASQGDNESKIRTGYNGLGGHSRHIQNGKSSIW